MPLALWPFVSKFISLWSHTELIYIYTRVGGRYLTQNCHRNALEAMINDFHKPTGWPVGNLIDDLKGFWRRDVHNWRYKSPYFVIFVKFVFVIFKIEETNKTVYFKAKQIVSEDTEGFNSILPRYIPTLSYCKAVWAIIFSPWLSKLTFNFCKLTLSGPNLSRRG